MSLRQALEKLRNDSGKEFQQDPCNVRNECQRCCIETTDYTVPAKYTRLERPSCKVQDNALNARRISTVVYNGTYSFPGHVRLKALSNV